LDGRAPSSKLEWNDRNGNLAVWSMSGSSELTTGASRSPSRGMFSRPSPSPSGTPIAEDAGHHVAESTRAWRRIRGAAWTASSTSHPDRPIQSHTNFGMTTFSVVFPLSRERIQCDLVVLSCPKMSAWDSLRTRPDSWWETVAVCDAPAGSGIFSRSVSGIIPDATKSKTAHEEARDILQRSPSLCLKATKQFVRSVVDCHERIDRHRFRACDGTSQHTQGRSASEDISFCWICVGSSSNREVHHVQGSDPMPAG